VSKIFYYNKLKTNRETRNTSKDYTGKGTATYSNGDVYIGDFKDGVSINSKLNK
jgi:hypothetical protein